MLPETLAAITQAVGAANEAPALPALRAAFPGVVFSRLDADDVRGETPVAQAGGWSLYLLDARRHCVALTDDLAAATGIVLARQPPA